MIVKCRICGRRLNRDSAYKIIKQDKNQYYCSSDEYNQMLLEKSCKQNICSILEDVLNNNVNYSLLVKEINALTKKHSCFKVLHYLQDNKDYLEQIAYNKTFSSDYGKIRYIFTVVANNIIQYQYKPRKPIVLNDELYESRYQPKPSKISLFDYE